MKWLATFLLILFMCFNVFADWDSCLNPISKYTDNLPKFGGDIYYVAQSQGNDSYSGKTPNQPFATIGAGIDAMSSGDALVIRAGTYAENVVLDCNSCELWFEIGAIIQPTSGTALTISGNYCRVICRDGALLVDPNGANTTGVLISGNFCYMAEVRVKCDSVADIGFDITGDGADLRYCRCSNPLVVAYKIQGDKIKLEDCCTGGTVADTSIGYWATNNCDKLRLVRCGSQGNATAGFQVDSGCTNGVISDCHSGGGDGERIDNGTTFHWPNFKSISAKEEHYHCYPSTDGEGTAGAPIHLTSDAQDENNGAATTQDYQ